MPTLNELREQRTKLALEMRSIVEGAASWDAQTEERFDRLDADLRGFDKRIDAAERANKAAAEVAAVSGAIVADGEARAQAPSGVPQLSPAEERQALLHWLRGTTASAPTEIRRYNASREARAQSVGTTTAGGYLVAQEFGTSIEAARRAFGAMLGVATVYPTMSGADLLLPTVDETGVSGSILAENAQISESAMTFGQTTISSYLYTSGLVLISQQLLQDSEFPLDTFIANALGERLGRAQNAHWTTGTGSSQPYGVVAGAASGKAGASGQTTTVIYNDLVDLVYSVDPAYRPNARWMLADASMAVIRKLVDSQSRPLWEPSVQAGQPDTILGYPVVINQSVATMAASAKSILFGDFSRYIIRDVSGIQLVRMDERYADYLQVGFYAFQRTGGKIGRAHV